VKQTLNTVTSIQMLAFVFPMRTQCQVS